MHRVKLTQAAMPALASLFNFKIHGDCIRDGQWTWDLEFSNLVDAASFAQVITSDGYSADIRQGDTVSTLNQSVVLTVADW